MAEDVRVLVVGGGPVGLSLACELLRHGVACRIIETRTEREAWSKAAGIQPRTLEVFHHMGVADAILAVGRQIHGAAVHTAGKELAHLHLEITGARYPFPVGLSQRRTEEILEARLEALGGKFERGVELTRFEQSPSEVTATLSHRDGSSETVTIPWLVGCDGAHSRVREQLDLPFEGTTFEQCLIQADLRAEFPHPVRDGEGQVFIATGGAAGFLPLFGDNRYRLILMNPPDELSEPTLENFQALVNQRAPEFDIRLSAPEWMVQFRFHSRIVPRYRVDRVFLAGDAAHIHSPAGAQGMNLGIQDAFNLAWKLAGVELGLARPELLDSYDRERRPIGAAIVNTTDAQTRRAFRFLALKNPIALALRNQLIKFVMSSGLIVDRLAQGVGGLNVAYPDSPVVGQYHSSIWSANVGTDTDTEEPDVRSWMQFEAGPGPGARVPELVLSDERSLSDLLAGPRHKLFLFDGIADTSSGYDNLTSIAERARREYGRLLEVFLVVPRETRPDRLPWTGPVLLDPEFELHGQFGARTESLYLIRPDGYVGYRSQPAVKEHLFEYLQALYFESA